MKIFKKRIFRQLESFCHPKSCFENFSLQFLAYFIFQVRKSKPFINIFLDLLKLKKKFVAKISSIKLRTTKYGLAKLKNVLKLWLHFFEGLESKNWFRGWNFYAVMNPLDLLNLERNWWLKFLPLSFGW